MILRRLALALLAASLFAAPAAFAQEKEKSKEKLPQVLLKTSKGDVLIELFEDEAPNTVANFVSLVEKGYYDGLTFHRVLDGFMAQGGDPREPAAAGRGTPSSASATAKTPASTSGACSAWPTAGATRVARSSSSRS